MNETQADKGLEYRNMVQEGEYTHMEEAIMAAGEPLHWVSGRVQSEQGRWA